MAGGRPRWPGWRSNVRGGSGGRTTHEGSSKRVAGEISEQLKAPFERQAGLISTSSPEVWGVPERIESRFAPPRTVFQSGGHRFAAQRGWPSALQPKAARESLSGAPGKSAKRSADGAPEARCPNHLRARGRTRAAYAVAVSSNARTIVATGPRAGTIGAGANSLRRRSPPLEKKSNGPKH